MNKKHGFCTILNLDGRILDKISWQKAMTLIMKDKPLTVIEWHDDDSILDGSGEEYLIPKMMMVQKYVKRRPQFTPSKRNIHLRDEYRCRYCGDDLSQADLTIDHVFPKSRGGGNTWKNLVTACVTCNSTKGDRTPEEAGMPLLDNENGEVWEQ